MCRASALSMNSSWASAITRLRSSEGWKEKSKLSSVLTGVSRAVCSAMAILRHSREAYSSSSNSSMASSAVTSPRSTRCRTWSRISSARGMRRPTWLPRMRSLTEVIGPPPVVFRVVSAWISRVVSLRSRRVSAREGGSDCREMHVSQLMLLRYSDDPAKRTSIFLTDTFDCLVHRPDPAESNSSIAGEIQGTTLQHCTFPTTGHTPLPLHPSILSCLMNVPGGHHGPISWPWDLLYPTGSHEHVPV